MSVGLFDGDITKYHRVPLNLEIMKLSTYYKKQREIVAMPKVLSPDKYTKFFYRKDYYDGEFPKEIYSNDRVSYGGHGFTLDRYVPLAPEIERCRPDREIYLPYEYLFLGLNPTKVARTQWARMCKAEHLRLSLDGENVWEDFEKQLWLNRGTYIVYLHDYNLNKVQNSDIILKEILGKLPRYSHMIPQVGTKFPIAVQDGKDFLKWTDFYPSKDNFLMEYQGIMEDEVLYEYVHKDKAKEFGYQLDYYITKGLTEQEVIERLPELYHQILYLKINKTKVVINYEKDFFSDKRWERLIDLFNMMINTAIALSKVNPKKDQTSQYFKDSYAATLYQFVTHFKKENNYLRYRMTVQEARDIFTFVSEKNYELFRRFYESEKIIFKGGQFTNE